MERFVSKETIYAGAILNLERWHVTLPDGAPALREVVCLKGASAVLAVDEEMNVILVRQARPAVGKVTYELPAGKLDSIDEDPEACAKRELGEETGLQASEWRKLTTLNPTPAFCNERLHIFLATGLSRGNAHPDLGEFVSVITLPYSQALAMVMDGTIQDGKTCVGLLMGAQLLGLSYI